MVLNIILMSILCVIAVEIIIRSRILHQVTTITSTAKRAVSVMASKRISDHWKEKVLPKYSLKIMRASVTMLGIFLAIIAVFFLIFSIRTSFYDFTFSVFGIIFAIVLSILYAKFRPKSD